MSPFSRRPSRHRCKRLEYRRPPPVTHAATPVPPTRWGDGYAFPEGTGGGNATGDIPRPTVGIDRRGRRSIPARHEVDNEHQRADSTDVS
jgi:hypothetical protein